MAGSHFQCLRTLFSFRAGTTRIALPRLDRRLELVIFHRLSPRGSDVDEPPRTRALRDPGSTGRDPVVVFVQDRETLRVLAAGSM